LGGKEAVSNLATEFQIQPSPIHTWVKLVLDQAEAAFQRRAGSRRADDGKDHFAADFSRCFASPGTGVFLC
jgi:type VI protein secretion system component VasK